MVYWKWGNKEIVIPEFPLQQELNGIVLGSCSVEASQALNVGLSKNHLTHKSGFHH